MVSIILASLAAYMLIILLIGYVSSKNSQRDVEAFFVADRNINWLQESMAVFTTIAPANALLGTVGLFYAGGSNLLGYVFGYVFLTPILYWMIGTKLRRLGQMRGYQTQAALMGDLFQSRFLFYGVAITGILFMIPYFMTNAVAVGLLLEQTTGFPYGWGAALFVVVSISYCLHGGLRAVANTDIFHGLLLLVFFVMCVVVLTLACGGVSALLDTPKAAINTSAAGLKTYFAWIFYVGISPVVWPDRSLRMYAVRDEANLRRGVIVTGVMLGIGSISYLVFGLAAEKLVPGGIKNTDTTLPTVLTIAAGWLIPFFIINAWGSGMSNFSAGMLSTANIFVKDLYQPYVVGKQGAVSVSEGNVGRPILVARIVMVVLSAVTLLVCLGNPPFIWSLIAMTISFFLQLTPMFILGLYWRGSSRVGAVTSWTVGVALTVLWTFVLAPPFGIFPGLTALLINTVLFAIVSLLVPGTLPEKASQTRLMSMTNEPALPLHQ